MRKVLVFGLVVAGAFAFAGEASAQGGYPAGKPRCRGREVYENPVSNASVSVGGFCRPKERDGYEWVSDGYGGYWRALVERPGTFYAKGYAKDGKWVEVGWQAEKPGNIWVEGHYNADGTWTAGRYERVQISREFFTGRWESGRWKDGYWRDIPYEGDCAAGETLVDSINLAKLFVPEFCRPGSRPGYSWKDSPYGGWWEPTAAKAGYVFVRGHAESEFGKWVGEEWIEAKPSAFFIQGRYDSKGGWIKGEWKEEKRGYTWKDGAWSTDGGWTAGDYSFDPAKACAAGEVYEEEVKLAKLFVPRYCRPTARVGYKWVDDQYGGYWDFASPKSGTFLIRGHVDGEFGDWIDEKIELTRTDAFFVQGRYDGKGKWVNGEWKEKKRGYAWKDGAWSADGGWTAGEYVFDPSTYCAKGETYEDEIKLAKLFVPKFCRPTNRKGYTWKDDTYGGYWQPNALKPGGIFVPGHISGEFGTWDGEKFEKPRGGYAFEPGHYDAKGGWVAGEWKEVKRGNKWEPGHYNTDGSWVAGSQLTDPDYKLSCIGGEVLVAEVKKTKLFIPAFCRPMKKSGATWVDNEFGGWWKPSGYAAAGKVFVRGHWDAKTSAWVDEQFVDAKPGKIFAQGHYTGKGEWVDGKWIDEKPGFAFTEGHFESDGSWVDGTWVESKEAPKGYPSGKPKGGGY